MKSNCLMCSISRFLVYTKDFNKKPILKDQEREFKPIGTLLEHELLDMDNYIHEPANRVKIITLYECTSCGYLRRIEE